MSEDKGSLLQDLEKLRALTKPTISQEEAETCQKWADLDGATAFHLIERHAANWADTGLMMEAWLRARAQRAEVDASGLVEIGVIVEIPDGDEHQPNTKFCNWNKEREGLPTGTLIYARIDGPEGKQDG